MRKPSVSQEAKTRLKAKGIKKEVVYKNDFIANPKHNECVNQMNSFATRLGLMTDNQKRSYMNNLQPIHCKHYKKFNKYGVYCGKCGAKVAELVAKDKKGADWCDVHLISYHKGDYWRGAFSAQISPRDEKLGFECACGNDSRDFRDNFDVSDKLKKENITAKEFGKKFKLKEL